MYEARKPELKQVTMLNPNESIKQLIATGNSFAMLTTQGRVLIPGAEFASWLELPVPSTHIPAE